MGEYRRREGGVHYDRYRNKWIIGRHHEFDFPQLADIYVYCWKHYGSDVANKVEAELQTNLTTTLSSYAKTSARNEIRDFLLGKLGAPSLPGAAGIAQRVIDAAVVALGDTAMKAVIKLQMEGRNYTCNYSPSQDVEVYCRWVLYSWVIDPDIGPCYTTYAPGTERGSSTAPMGH